MRKFISAKRFILLVFFGLAAMGLFVAWHFVSARQLDGISIALENRDLAKARSHLKWASFLCPYDTNLLILRARIERLDGEPQKAQECLGWYRRRASKLTNTYRLENVLLRTQYGGLHETESSLRNLLKNDPDHPDASFVLEVLAAEYQKRFELDKAVQMLQLWERRSPDNAHVAIQIARIYEEMKNKAELTRYYLRALRLAPHHAEARLEYLEYLLEQNSVEECKSHVKFLLQFKGDDLRVKLAHGRFLFLTNEFKKARFVLREVAEAEPNDPAAIFELARIELQSRHLNEAEKHARRVIELDYANIVAHYILYQCLTGKTGMETQADKQFRVYQKVLEYSNRLDDLVRTDFGESNGRQLEIYIEIADICMKLKKDRYALPWLERAIKQNATYAPAHRLLAQYYASRNEHLMAARHFDLTVKKGN